VKPEKKPLTILINIKSKPPLDREEETRAHQARAEIIDDVLTSQRKESTSSKRSRRKTKNVTSI